MEGRGKRLAVRKPVGGRYYSGQVDMMRVQPGGWLVDVDSKRRGL